MEKLSEAFCINRNCKDYGVRNQGNIRTRGKYGLYSNKVLLYCHTCGQRFAHSRSTAFFGLRVSDETILKVLAYTAGGTGIRETGRMLGISKDTVNRIVFRAIIAKLSWQTWSNHWKLIMNSWTYCFHLLKEGMC